MALAQKIKAAVRKRLPRITKSADLSCEPYTAIDFKKAQKRAHALADHIESNFEQLAHILLEYESYEVMLDETSRSLDLLRNLEENEHYFKTRIGAVTSFLPRNQPLYAFTCFVLVPSFMASEVHFRIPNSMRHFFPKLLALLNVIEDFPNVRVSNLQRTEFLRERSALKSNPITKETMPVTEVVIFTGTSLHADQLRTVFDQRTLFITNGSGHNPLVVSKDAIISDAVEATLTLQLYNQGQDCAAPNTILIHEDVFADFLRMIRDEIRTVRVGDYRDRRCRVGPISDPKDLVRIQDLLIENREWLDPTTPGIIRAYDAILEPTIINKPLKVSGNFSEIFAPVIFLQKYANDDELATYFEDPRYAQNAMYVTLYGTSPYVKSFIGREIGGKVLHTPESFLHNNHLHAPGAERGTKPYGGNGYGASSLSINGKIMPKATLPQRDIFEWVAKPLANGAAAKKTAALRAATDTIYKDVQKLLRLKAQDTPTQDAAAEGVLYVDLQSLPKDDRRYAEVEEDSSYRLLETPNVSCIARLTQKELGRVRTLHALLPQKISLSVEDFKTALYQIPKEQSASDEQNQKQQLEFFQAVYELLFGKRSGPRLAQFLRDAELSTLLPLLDV
jgi:acyl-CoA reductase-like NAD-dependent aldehyde dehydrogenase